MISGRGDEYLESEFPSVPIYLVGGKNGAKNVDLRETNLLSLSYGNIVPKDIDSHKGLLPASFDGYQVVQPGYTILRFTDLQNDQKSLRSGLVTERGIITSAYIGFKPDTRLVAPAYFAYVMRALDVRKAFYQMGFGVRQSLGWDEFSAIRIPLPDLDTQRRIADYLDTEVGEMDAMVARLEKLIADLEERRSVRIADALRRAGAEPIRVNLLAQLKTGGTPKNVTTSDGGVSWVKPEDLSVDSVGLLIDDHFAEQLPIVSAGSALFCGIGSSLAKVGFAQRSLVTNQQITALIPRSGVNGKLLYYSLQSMRQRIHSIAPRSTMPIFNNVRLGNEPILFLDDGQQDSVVAELDDESAAIDGIIDRSRTLIDDLKARKSALITEVVTGRKQV
ncbi:hypothetical protein [Corynebacterium sp.]|uniref:hypothetical protein n=1 Tax=Corynebacterium sp. TaxID=1720 RepID=UPI0027BB07F7|nr:hypothetical protein [Corynebacterium sp.]